MTNRKPLRAGRILAGAALAGAASWWIRHKTARAVRVWKPGRGEFVRAARLVTRVAGSGEPVFVLLHGLVASGETFGVAYDRLAERGTLVVPDLLGFSRSMDFAREAFALGDHLAALDEMMRDLGLANARFVVGGHSFGGVLALHWAARRATQTDAVVTWGAPLFRNEAEGRAQLKKMGMLERLFARDSSFAKKSCELMCAHRKLAGMLAVALSPDLPLPVSKRVVLHTWPAYRGAVAVLFSEWRNALRTLAEHQVPLTLVAGTEDDSQPPGLNEQLARAYSNVRAVQIRSATHIVALTHGEACAQELLRATSMKAGH